MDEMAIKDGDRPIPLVEFKAPVEGPGAPKPPRRARRKSTFTERKRPPAERFDRSKDFFTTKPQEDVIGRLDDADFRITRDVDGNIIYLDQDQSSDDGGAQAEQSSGEADTSGEESDEQVAPEQVNPPAEESEGAGPAPTVQSTSPGKAAKARTGNDGSQVSTSRKYTAGQSADLYPLQGSRQNVHDAPVDPAGQQVSRPIMSRPPPQPLTFGCLPTTPQLIDNDGEPEVDQLQSDNEPPSAVPARPKRKRGAQRTSTSSQAAAKPTSSAGTEAGGSQGGEEARQTRKKGKKGGSGTSGASGPQAVDKVWQLTNCYATNQRMY